MTQAELPAPSSPITSRAVWLTDAARGCGSPAAVRLAAARFGVPRALCRVLARDQRFGFLMSSLASHLPRCLSKKRAISSNASFDAGVSAASWYCTCEMPSNTCNSASTPASRSLRWMIIERKRAISGSKTAEFQSLPPGGFPAIWILNC
jgi:hypothetical protein